MSLSREIKEELDCDIVVEKLVHVSSTVYSDGAHYVVLFYNCSLLGGVPRATVHEAFEWVNPSDLHYFHFVEGDREIVELLERNDV